MKYSFSLLGLLAASGLAVPVIPRNVALQDPGKAPTQILAGVGIGVGVSKNDVHDKVCKKYTFIFARGTTEAGNIGSKGFAGSTLLGHLQALYGDDLAAQGVNYDAANFFSNFELGDRGGVNDMEWEADEAVFNCPSTTLILGGYSQGAMLTHRSVGHMYSTTLERIGAIVMFGDPFHQGTAGIGKFPTSIPSNHIKTYCHKTDAVCLGTPFILPGHLTYADEAADASEWVQSVLSGQSGEGVGDDSNDLSSSSLENEPESSSIAGLDDSDFGDSDDSDDYDDSSDSDSMDGMDMGSSSDDYDDSSESDSMDGMDMGSSSDDDDSTSDDF